MNSQNMKVHVVCGQKGVGKTTAVTNNWQKHVLLNCGDPINKHKTNAVLFLALSEIFEEIKDDYYRLIIYLKKAIKEKYILIIDEAENIDEELLQTILNIAIMGKCEQLIFTFDIEKASIYENHLFRRLLEWNIVTPDLQLEDFVASKIVIENHIKKSIKNATDVLVNEIIDLTSSNFLNINKILFLIVKNQTSFDKISDNVVKSYMLYIVDDKLSELPEEITKILKKSSLIGEMFHSHLLESPDCFNVQGVKLYLKKLDGANLFIKNYVNTSVYRFISNKEYTSLIESIDPEEKIDLQKILLEFYLKKLPLESNKDVNIEYLNQIKLLSNDLGDYNHLFFANKKLLYNYLKIKDNKKVREILKDLLDSFTKSFDDKILYLYLCNYKIHLEMNFGLYKDALEVIKDIKSKYSSSFNLLLQYYYAKCLYNTGDIDASYEEAKKIQSVLKHTSSNAKDNQPIYAFCYSLLATIEHHFGIKDFGNRHYALALDHAKNKLENKSTYYEILKKCDMYYSLEYSEIFLRQCYKYYDSIGDIYNSSRVKVNLGIELIFNKIESKDEATSLIEKSIKSFSNTPSEDYSYASNNLAIVRIIGYEDFDRALSLLKDALLIGLSSFTYMTIYLNICMCYLFIGEYHSKDFKYYYAEFCKYHKMIISRENSTQYDDLYKCLLDILIEEHQGNQAFVIRETKSLLNKNVSKFFVPLLKDILYRNAEHIVEKEVYQDNYSFYENMNKYRLFLAEFRFWE